MDEIVNCKIVSTFLGIEDHGIFTWTIGCEGDGWFQAAGGYDEKRSSGEKIQLLLTTLGVLQWEHLKNINVRIKRNNTKILAIGHIVDNQWFYFKQEQSNQFSNGTFPCEEFNLDR
jgi:hypothetical protein